MEDANFLDGLERTYEFYSKLLFPTASTHNELNMPFLFPHFKKATDDPFLATDHGRQLQ
jgi:hypothetical protein